MKLRLHACLHLLQGQLHKLRHQQLLGGDGLQLPLFLLLLLYLYLFQGNGDWDGLLEVFFELFGQGVQFLRLFVGHALPHLLTGQ